MQGFVHAGSQVPTGVQALELDFYFKCLSNQSKKTRFHNTEF